MNIQQTIAEAEAIYKAKAPQLAAFQLQLPQMGRLGAHTQINELSIHQWLSKVTHQLAGRHRKMRRYATAYYQKQTIVYNPLYLVKIEESKDFLDTVLHELGHLFTYHFFKEIGHQFQWQRVGSIVGYAEVGCTSDARRQRMASYAAHSGTVEVAEPLGTLTTSAPMNFSTTTSPVRKVWVICERFPTFSRKWIIATCVRNGINRNTAATQYAAWKRSQNPPTFRW